MEEIWKKIEGFEDYYEVSNLGRVRRIGDYCNQNASWELKEYKILKPRIHNNGYLRVMFSVNGKHYDKYIHRLVAKAFCKNMNIKKYKEVKELFEKQNKEIEIGNTKKPSEELISIDNIENI